MYVYAFSQDGQICHEAHTLFPDNAPLDNLHINHPGCLVYTSAELQHDSCPKELLRATVEDGAITGLYLSSEAPVSIYAHIAITGGDGDTPPGVELGSGATLAITAQVRAGLDPASPLIEALGGEWRITIRNQAGGPPDIVQVLVEGGQVVDRNTHEPGVVYDPPEVIGVYAVDESDFTPLVIAGQTYVLKLADPAQAKFKVYRKL